MKKAAYLVSIPDQLDNYMLIVFILSEKQTLYFTYDIFLDYQKTGTDLFYFLI